MMRIAPLIDKMRVLAFSLNGKKPWTYGYDAYKWKTISSYLQQGCFNDGELCQNYGFRIDERIVEYPWLLSRLPKEGRRKGGSLLDAGSILNYEPIVSHPSLSEKKVFISTLAPEGNCFWRKGISYVFEDVRDSCYKDEFFDSVACISTLEHIGMDNTMLYTSDPSKNENKSDSYQTAITEFHRILKPGGTLFISVPFGKHVNHGWFQAFDDSMIDNVIDVFDPESYVESHFRYRENGWVKSSRLLSKDAMCFDIHQQKKYDRDFAASSRAIACLEMIK